ncbi:hypothetical protein D9M71_512390 [compost metagenome]
MLKAQRFEVAGEVQLHVAVIPLQLAVVEVASQGATVGLQAIGFDRIALQRPVQLLHSAGEHPAVV